MADQINQMNKLLDPSSTFREGEADLSKNTQKEDLALIYSLMKMLDPSSPLREGETKQMNSNMFNSLQMMADGIMKGNKLPPEIKQRLVDQGISLMDQMSGGVVREIDPNMVIREGEMQQMNNPKVTQ
jgi:hypothetical protein